MFGCGVPVPSAHRPQGEPQYLSVHRGFPHQPVTVHERHVHPARIGRNGDHHRTGSASVGPLLRECAGKSKCGPKSVALASPRSRTGHKHGRPNCRNKRTSGEHSSGLFRDFSRLFGTYRAVLFPSRVRAVSSPRSANTEIQREKWSERGDLNSRPPVPKTGALTELRYAPTLETKHFRDLAARTNSGLPPDCHRNWSISAGFCSRKSPVSTAAPSSLIAPGATASSVRARAPIQAGSLTYSCSSATTATVLA